MKKRILKSIIGKVRYQRFFRRLHSLSLVGMNYGNGGDFRKSGEEFAAEYVRDNLLQVSKKWVIFDVGANIGNYSLELAKIFKNKDLIIQAFEPSLKTYEKLEENTQGISCIKINNIGLGEKAETLMLYSNEESSSIASVYNRQLDHFGITLAPVEQIELSTIDIFCQKNNISHIHFLKLDIEGHEYNALKGANDMIQANAIDYIQFEFGGTQIDSRTFFRDFWYLLKDRYKFYRIVINGLVEIKEYQELNEVFMAINFLLERKL